MSATADPVAGGLPARSFATTQWGLVTEAGQGESPAAREALERLCRAYWQPLYVYVRRLGYGVADAQDLTQAFFVRVIEREYFRLANPGRGRLRSFLLTCLKHFLAHEQGKATAQRRGGGIRFVPLEAEGGCAASADGDAAVGCLEARFDRDWSLALLRRAMNRLDGEQNAAGKAEQYARLRVFLSREPAAGEYERLAAELGQARGSLAVAVHRLRQRLNALVREEIEETLADPADVADELRYLVRLMASEAAPQTDEAGASTTDWR